MQQCILFGTTNPRKFDDIRSIAAPLPVDLLAPWALGLELLVEECGSQPEENARIKAEAYCQAAKMPTVALDSGLQVDGLPDSQQPGVHVRRVGGIQLSDEAMIEHYSRVFQSLGGQVGGLWITALAVVLPDGRRRGITISHPTTFTAEACEQRNPGNPLNSLQIDPQTGRYRAQEPLQAAERNGSSGAFRTKVYRFFVEILSMLQRTAPDG